MLRSILVVLFLLLYAIFSIIAIPLLWIIGKCNIGARDRISFAIVQNSFRIILFLSGTRLTVTGKDRIPKDSAVLYVGNHRSYYDTMILYSLVPELTGFVAKIETEKFPVLNIWMKYMNCLFLDRDDIRKGLKTILEGIEYMKKGISICIFPEGTRNKNESELEMLPFKEGSFKLAEKSGCPIIPVALHNTVNCLEAHFPKIKKTYVTVEFGEPIYLEKMEREERKFIGAKVRDEIIGMLSDKADSHSEKD